MSEKVKVVFNGQSIELDKETITQGIEKGEVAITDENILLFTKEENEKRLKNVETSSYNKGKKDGVEIEWKETKRKLGLDIDGKNGDEIIDAFRVKILADAKIEPSKKIQELEADMAKLKSNLLIAEEEKTKLKTSFELKEKEGKINSVIFNSIPEKAINETISRNDISALFKANGYGVDIQDGKEIVLFNGEVMKDQKTLEPVAVKPIIEKFVTDKGLLKPTGGAGGGDATPGQHTPGTLEAFNKEMADKDIKFNSPAYIKEMQSRIKDKTLKI